MSKINIKLMSESTYETLRKNIDKYVGYFYQNQESGEWINTITSEPAFEIKRYQIEDFELIVPKDYKDHETELKNAKILFETLRTLPGYILSEPRFWLWIMFEKSYQTAIHSMEFLVLSSFKHQWLFDDGLRRGLFFNIISRLYYRTKLTYCPEHPENPYYLTEYVMEKPTRFREISWRSISNYDFVVKAMLKAEIRVNNELVFDEKGEYFDLLAKEVSKLGSIKLIDAMDDKELEEYIYYKYLFIVKTETQKELEKKYLQATGYLDSNNLKKLQRAREIFSSLKNYKNSAELEKVCKEKNSE